jgi:hypothetical protein
MIRKEALQIRKKLLKTKLFTAWNNSRNDLSGACGLASYLLKKRLNELNIKSEVYWTTCRTHVWVETKTHLIDITYTQFNANAPLVLMLNKTSKEYQKYLKKMKSRKQGRLKRLYQDYTWIKKHGSIILS